MKYSKQMEIKNLDQVKIVVSTASSCPFKLDCKDNKGHVADASSILGMLALDYTVPVTLGCDREEPLEEVEAALNEKKKH